MGAIDVNSKGSAVADGGVGATFKMGDSKKNREKQKNYVQTCSFYCVSIVENDT